MDETSICLMSASDQTIRANAQPVGSCEAPNVLVWQRFFKLKGRTEITMCTPKRNRRPFCLNARWACGGWAIWNSKRLHWVARWRLGLFEALAETGDVPNRERLSKNQQILIKTKWPGAVFSVDYTNVFSATVVKSEVYHVIHMEKNGKKQTEVICISLREIKDYLSISLLFPTLSISLYISSCSSFTCIVVLLHWQASCSEEMFERLYIKKDQSALAWKEQKMMNTDKSYIHILSKSFRGKSYVNYDNKPFPTQRI